MMAAPSQDWNLFQQIFVEHWDGFKRVYPRYDKRYYDARVDKMLGCGNPDKMGYTEYRCLHCGEGTHRVAMSCKSSLCLRCAKVYVDNWVAQVSKIRHEGVIYRPIVLTVPDVLRTTFYQNAQALLSPFMRCGVRCLDDVFSRVSGKPLKGGYIVVIQTHGRNGQYNPICISLPPVEGGSPRRSSGCIWTICHIRCCAKSGSGICERCCDKR